MTILHRAVDATSPVDYGDDVGVPEGHCLPVPEPATRNSTDLIARSLRNEYVRAAACLALLIVVFFSPLVRNHATFSTVSSLQEHFYPWLDPVTGPQQGLAWQLDQADYVYPRQVFLDDALKQEDQLPLWNSQVLGGTPFFAQSGARMAYPPYMALTALLSPSWTHDIYVMLHLFVAGIGMFALMKAFRTGFAGALLAAVSWAFGSYIMAWVMLEMVAAVAALLPVALLFVVRWHQRRSLIDLLLAGLALGLLVVGTSVDLALVAFLVVVAYAGVLALRRAFPRGRALPLPARFAVLLQPVLLAAAALAVAAAALVPFLVLLGRSGRIQVPIDVQLKSLTVPVRSFLHAFTPPPRPTSVMSFVNGQVFVGTITALLAVGAVFLRRAGAGLGRSLLIASFVLVTGTPLAYVVYHLVPFLGQLSGFGRMLFVWNLGLAILGGLGLDALLRIVRERPAGDRRPALTGRSARLVPVALACTCIAVTAVQLIVYGRHINVPFQPREPAELFPSTPAIEAARKALGPEPGAPRALTVAPVAGPHALVPSTPMAVGLPVGNGYEPVVPSGVNKLWRVVVGEPVAMALEVGQYGTFALQANASSLRTDLLSRVGVGVLVAPPGEVLGQGWAPGNLAARGLRPVYRGPDGTVLELVDRPGRAMVVSDAEWVASSSQALARFANPTFDVRREVILEGAPPGPAPDGGGEGASVSRVQWERDRPNDLRLSVTTATAGWLVVLDSWDPGWRATVAGKGRPVLRANYNFRAVRVPAGTSVVKLSYRPSEVSAGVLVSGLATGCLVAAIAFGWVRRRMEPASMEPRD